VLWWLTYLRPQATQELSNHAPQYRSMLHNLVWKLRRQWKTTPHINSLSDNLAWAMQSLVYGRVDHSGSGVHQSPEQTVAAETKVAVLFLLIVRFYSALSILVTSPLWTGCGKAQLFPLKEHWPLRHKLTNTIHLSHDTWYMMYGICTIYNTHRLLLCGNCFSLHPGGLHSTSSVIWSGSTPAHE
jgi:hypothetical protein